MPTLLKYRLVRPKGDFDPPWYVPEEGYVFMTADHLADDSLIEFAGSERMVRELKERVLRSYGFRARLIDDYTSPRDLACAMQGRLLADYKPELISGHELFPTPQGES